MANTSEEPVADGRRYKLDSNRITLLAVLASGVYGAGIIMAMWAARLSVAAAHASRPIPAVPWTVAFILVVSGMLAVIYGFFFRPRELRVNGTHAALVYWDGNGKKIARDQVRKVEAGRRRIVLSGSGKRLVIGRIFRDWDAIRAEFSGWGAG
jgi:hypothetical protein